MYSLDFRKKVLTIKVQEKLSIRDVAKRFKLSRDTVFRWTKTLEPKTKRDKPATKIDRDALRKDVEEYPDAYQYERAQRLGVSPSGIQRALKHLKVTYKKNASSSQGGSGQKIDLLPEDSRS